METNNLKVKWLSYTMANLVLLVFIGIMSLFYFSLKDRIALKSKLVTFAKSQTSLSQVLGIDFYNGSQSYYTIKGKDKNQKTIFLTINEKRDKIYSYHPEDGISAKKASQIVQRKEGSKIDKVTFGRENHRAIWEVKTKNTFYLIDFESSKVLKKEVT
ncbi:cell wall elongation regulator TseB-like domain-containing protein [Streptococcus catagoni]|uniref:cell wall elongation regulator TseB-like domain-containing protein n=1 Tax=Streptococcus catagoni TaxID=2654874 RepID=UPI00140C4909|nr:DUF5590 domain-containing protein [Streptococcus catagoni]